LWYLDTVLVHSKRVKNARVNLSGNYNFLKTAELINSRWCDSPVPQRSREYQGRARQFVPFIPCEL